MLGRDEHQQFDTINEDDVETDGVVADEDAKSWPPAMEQK